MTVLVELDGQYRQLREECGLLERSERGKLLVTGTEAAEYLQGQLTNDIEAIAPGEGAYAALLDRKGHMQGDMRVLRPGEGPDLLLDTESEALEAVRRHLAMYKIGRDVDVVDISAARALMSLLGPRAIEIAGSAALAENFCEEVTVAGTQVLAVGTAGGIDLIFDTEAGDRVTEALLAAGAAEVSPEAVEILRIEAGRPRFGAEMGTETMPAEAGIVEQAVSFTKGCYIGQETVARLHYKGKPNRHLRGLKLSGAGRAQPGEAIRLGDKEVGKLGSAGVSPAFGPIGLAILRREAEPGATVVVGEDGVTAEVVAVPFG
ncbi:MAG TPA: glycine cleavage T C-terminal barrel domain-containing protein [Solirubrobacterales bacterium]|jgi:folate-binding protein YgfZ|nr:glycine cleavage T C-terminal barrel domain-containing protein [Solirubrobacterales bacterium]